MFALLLALASAGVAAAEPTPATARPETIRIEGREQPATFPTVQNFKPIKTPPYSDKAILGDAWTKAWLFLDVDERGDVRRIKFLKRPGFDLEPIAVSEVFHLKFKPGENADGKPIATYITWSIEWPSQGWLRMFVGTTTRMPPLVDVPARRLDSGVPCAGSGPFNFGSMYRVYKDCSKADLSKVNDEAWVYPPESAAATSAR